MILCPLARVAGLGEGRWSSQDKNVACGFVRNFSKDLLSVSGLSLESLRAN